MLTGPVVFVGANKQLRLQWKDTLKLKIAVFNGCLIPVLFSTFTQKYPAIKITGYMEVIPALLLYKTTGKNRFIARKAANPIYTRTKTGTIQRYPVFSFL
jgi:hypothetical protein